jgi:hypothetical protein
MKAEEALAKERRNTKKHLSLRDPGPALNNRFDGKSNHKNTVE